MHPKLLLICLLFCSCASSRMTQTELYFGQSKPDGSLITATEWDHFKESHISKAFPGGSTIIPSSGTWYDATQKKIIAEPTYVLIFLHKKSKPVSATIDSVRSAYKKMFQQQSILRVDKKVKATF